MSTVQTGNKSNITRKHLIKNTNKRFEESYPSPPTVSCPLIAAGQDKAGRQQVWPPSTTCKGCWNPKQKTMAANSSHEICTIPSARSRSVIKMSKSSRTMPAGKMKPDVLCCHWVCHPKGTASSQSGTPQTSHFKMKVTKSVNVLLAIQMPVTKCLMNFTKLGWPVGMCNSSIFACNRIPVDQPIIQGVLRVANLPMTVDVLNPEIAVWYTLKTFHQTLPQVFIAVKRSRIRILNQCCQPRTNVWRIRPDRTFGLVFLSPNHNWKCCHQFRTIDVLHKARKRTHRCNTTMCSRNRSPSSQRQLWIVRLPNTTVCKKVDPITSRSHLRAKTSHQVRNGQQCSLTSDVCE